MTQASPSIDLFCRVVDNFGDIGVCWRLARMLAGDQGCAVRLYVDDFATFFRIEPRLNAQADIQTLAGVTVIRWTDSVIQAHAHTPGDAVIEAFACDLPDTVVAGMKAAANAPVWMDLEYLSAEDWVDENHAIISTNPMTGLKKTLFFPGFTTRTGGLSREAGLLARRDAFQASIPDQDTWRTAHGIPARDPDILDISLFCYDTAPLAGLVHAAAAMGRRVRFLAPAGVARAQIESVNHNPDGMVTVQSIPFLTQDDYDKLLWTCDVNFVRGEDSFVRAIWAGRPMVWQIYVQDDDAHLVKLQAFLNRYSENLNRFDADALAQFTVMWNVGAIEKGGPHGTRDFFEALPRLNTHAQDWSRTLAEQPDLASQIVRFIQTQTDVRT